MKRLAVTLAATAAMFAAGVAPVAAQEEARVFQPSGPWTADFGDDYCRLMRTFSDGRDTVSISFEKIDTRPSMRLLVVGNALSLFRGSEQLGVDFLPTESPSRIPFARSTTADGEQLLIFDTSVPRVGSENPRFVQVYAATETTHEDGVTSVHAMQMPSQADREAQELERAATITAISFSSGLTTPVRVETGSLRNAIEVLQTCGYDLLSSWGLDGEKHRTLTRGALATEGPVISRRTIPFGEYSRLVGGSNMVRVMVSAEGVPASCHIHSPTLSARVNQQICREVMSDTRFVPALDADGQPIASHWTMPPFALMGPPSGGR